MSITDELRKWARDNTVQGEVLTTYPVQHPVQGTLESLLAIADRIDAELAERYMELPVDADGVPIHVGDELEGYGYTSGGAYCKAVMGWGVMAGEREQPYRNWLMWSADALRHHRPPTVEDILREFALRAIRESEGNYGDLDETCAEYAKRLRLAGEG